MDRLDSFGEDFEKRLIKRDIANSRENIANSRENIANSRENIANSRENIAALQKNTEEQKAKIIQL